MQHHISCLQILRYYRIAKTNSRKACIFGEGMQFDRTGSCPFTFINTVWYIVLTDISFICRIINDHTAMLICIINPFLQLRLCDRGTGRIVWKAQINDIRYFLWQLRCKIIFCGTWHIDHIAPCFCLRIILACSSCHNIGIYINRINRVTDSDLVILGKYFLNVTGIALGTIRYKNFIRADITATQLIIIFRNSFSQKFIPKIRCIAMEGFCYAHLRNRTMQCINDHRCKWLGHIADSQTDDLFIRVLLCKCVYFLSDRGKKVTAG